MASACCTRASSCSGANQRATGTTTAKMRPRSGRHAVPPSTVSAGVTIGGHHAGLSGVAGIALLDGNYVEQPAAARFMTPNAANIRNTRSLQLLPQQRGAHEAAHIVELAGRPRGRRAEDDRVVAMIEPLDLDNRFGTPRAGVVSGPLSERAFIAFLAGHRVAFDHDLGRSREGQARVLAFNHLHRTALQSSDPVVLG